MASREEAIGKGVKSTENKLFKGAGFNKKSSEPDTASKNQSRPSDKAQIQKENVVRDDDNFDGMSDEDKSCYSYAAKNYDGVSYPENWASKHAITSGLPEKGLAKAANKFMQDFKKNKMSKDEVFKYPFWSAARDWDPNQIGKLGGKMSSGLNSFKFDPDMIASVRSQFY